MTGSPYFSYNVNNSTSTTIFTLLSASVRADYLFVVYPGYPSKCNIHFLGYYTILAAFNMTDALGKVHSMFMIRNTKNPDINYNQTWNATDPNWTNALVAQVPFGVDPRKSYITDGFFFV